MLRSNLKEQELLNAYKEFGEAAKNILDINSDILEGRGKKIDLRKIEDDLARANETIEILKAENERLLKAQDEMKTRFNQMAVTMQHVWNRLGIDKGTWEEKINAVISWGRQPDVNLLKRTKTVKKRSADEDEGGVDNNGVES